jgi:hypothetical protein
MHSRKELFVSQLARKHPVAFFQLLDLCARSGQLDAPAAVKACQIAGNGSGRIGVKGLADLLSSPAATAALGSALCSILKLCAQHTMQPVSQAALSIEQPALIAVHALSTSLLPLGNMLHPAMCESLSSAGVSASSSSSSRSQQCRASAVFLLVLAFRGVLSLHEAVACMGGATEAGLSPDATAAQMRTADDAAAHMYMVSALQVLSNMLAALNLSQMKQPVAAAAAAGTAAERVQAVTEDGSSSSSNSSSPPLYWLHLLRLHDSRKLNATFSAFRRVWTPAQATAVIRDNTVTGIQDTPGGPPAAGKITAAVSSQQMTQMRQLYHDSLAICRAVTARAPLPVVCNNPGCGELSGVSEAAAARYVCAGCGCRYCSAACQAAGWRSHKKACRRMAACGLRVDGI